MQAATAQLTQSRLFAPDQGSQSIHVTSAAGSAQLVLDGVQDDDQFANGARVVIAHRSLGRSKSRCPTV
ncbi:hypothetical protein AB0F43_25890 [Kribbella sp. NPDC023972]|uniref:hypothetical protein n=1 Tax=Kribbella sp. NPDC023972 TaxID=3154795 RepID=UPI0033D8CF43